MKSTKTVFFDFDGVIADTEPQYDAYMNNLGDTYGLGIENFAAKVKGTPTPDIMKKYFSHLRADECREIEQNLIAFEVLMDFPEVPGALDFIKSLKGLNIKIGLVTSSQKVKMDRALRSLDLESMFDTIVTADRITRGKPDPMCYLLAARDVSVEPENCLVFEDSLHGIRAGLEAQMSVVGVTTSFSEEQMDKRILFSIPNFLEKKNILDKILSLL